MKPFSKNRKMKHNASNMLIDNNVILASIKIMAEIRILLLLI